ncbi:MAG: hypothetical protein IANPNBLG_03306 [Bryobacteraceae bacterium]|nr:hypothetical protein [Bryobacteraceae bacterium]
MPLRAGERGGRVADEEMPQSHGILALAARKTAGRVPVIPALRHAISSESTCPGTLSRMVRSFSRIPEASALKSTKGSRSSTCGLSRAAQPGDPVSDPLHLLFSGEPEVMKDRRGLGRPDGDAEYSAKSELRIGITHHQLVPGERLFLLICDVVELRFPDNHPFPRFSYCNSNPLRVGILLW